MLSMPVLGCALVVRCCPPLLCLGLLTSRTETLATFEALAVTAEMVGRWDFRLAPDTEEPHFGASLTLPIRNPYKVRCRLSVQVVLADVFVAGRREPSDWPVKWLLYAKRKLNTKCLLYAIAKCQVKHHHRLRGVNHCISHAKAVVRETMRRKILGCRRVWGRIVLMAMGRWAPKLEGVGARDFSRLDHVQPPHI